MVIESLPLLPVTPAGHRSRLCQLKSTLAVVLCASGETVHVTAGKDGLAINGRLAEAA